MSFSGTVIQRHSDDRGGNQLKREMNGWSASDELSIIGVTEAQKINLEYSISILDS
jgi:hypothetical protein